MAVELMSFRNFTFPYNPAQIEVGYDRVVRVVNMPFAAPVTQELGRGPRVVRGQGEWPEGGTFGPLARHLEEEFRRGGAGRLICPVTEPMIAHFTALKLIGKGGENTVQYAFEFVEDAAGQSTADADFSGVVRALAEQGGGAL